MAVGMAEIQLKDLQAVLSGRMGMYQSYIGNDGFMVTVGKDTSFDHTKNAVILGAREFKEHGREISKIDFDVFHELGHLVQLWNAPQAYLKLIDDSKDVPQKFEFYNCILDITVNSLISLQYPQYRGSDGGFSEEIKDYYQQELFKKRDLREVPLTAQFSYYLLNLGMGVSEDLLLSPEVISATNEKIKFAGREYSITEIISKYIKPQITTSGLTALNIEEARTIIDFTLLPIFEELLKLDSRVNKDSQSVILNPKDLKDFLDSAKKYQANKNLTPGERSILNLKATLEDQGLSNDLIKKIADLQPTIQETKELLKRIRDTHTIYNRKEKDHQIEGFDLDMETIIEEFHSLRTNSRLPIYIGEEVSTEVSLHPKKLRLCFLLDLSGSMADFLSKVKDEFVVLAGATIAANLESSMEAQPIEYEIGIYAYSDEAYKIFDFKAIKGWEDIGRCFDEIEVIGGTQSHFGFKALLDKYTTLRNLEGTENPDIVDILLEVTDGDTSNPLESKSLADDIKKLGVHLLGIKFTGAVISDKSALTPPSLAPNGDYIPPPSRSVEANESFDIIHGGKGSRIHSPRQFPLVLHDKLNSIISKG